MKLHRIYLLAVWFACSALLYQAMPLHQIFGSSKTVLLLNMDEDETKKDDNENGVKKGKSSFDELYDFNPTNFQLAVQANQQLFYHKTYYQKQVTIGVFAPPPECA